MSLFPAYKPNISKGNFSNGSSGSVDASKNNQTDLAWLSNASYTLDEEPANYATINTDKKKETDASKSENKIEYGKSKNRKRKKKKGDKIDKLLRHKKTSSSQKSCSSLTSFRDEQFYEDKKQEKGNFLVDTLYRPAIPRYDKYSHYFKMYKIMKRNLKREKKTPRYFVQPSSKSESTCNTNNENNLKEEDLTKVTEDFNKRLAENPKDVETWLEYIHFQDKVLDFENVYRSNPTTGGERATIERKLAILDRATHSNPASELLLATRLALLESFRPADQVAEECSRMLVQDPGCMPLWRALVRTSRNNMARCVAPAVLQTFSRAVSRLGQLRMHRPPATIDRDILALVLECGLFLQQAGLWEQLFMLLQMYLSLNLTASGQIAIPADTQEQTLREQEDTVVASGLPLSVMWLRVEKLRAAYHYQPLADCESDPQRVVFSDDIAGMLQPVMSSELRLLLVASVFVLLKVPVLPTRHTTLQCLGLLQIPSAINNVEALLAAVFSTGFSGLCQCRYLSGCVELVSEPQFLRDGPGQQQFLGTCTWLLQHCAELLPTDDAVIAHVWLLRLYSLLCRLHSLQLADIPLSVVKQARGHAKRLLKLPQFRENLWLYSEYAMVEKDAGDLDRSCKILQTALALPPASTSGEPDVHRVLLCRRLVESLLIQDYSANRESALRVLMSVVDDKPLTSYDAPASSVTLTQCTARWHQRTTALTEQLCTSVSQRLTVPGALCPHLLVEWLACHALFLFLTRSVWDATALLQQHIDNIHDMSTTTVGGAWVEQLYEVSTGLLYLHTKHCRTSFAVLRSTVVKALKSFPNNLTLLNILACIETGNGGGGSPMWKLVSYFPPSAPVARLVLVFVVRCRITLHATEDTLVSNTGNHYLRNLLKQLTMERESGECPLMWRLHLQLVAALDTAPQIKATFYKALQACPWIKALYLDAVKFLPEELPEVQDLLIEKELRLHTTPEELQILRD